MKKSLLSLVLILSFTLTGCNSLGNVSNSKYDVIAEYIASMILKYDRFYEEKLVNQSDIALAKEVPLDDTKVPEDTNATQTISSEDDNNSNITESTDTKVEDEQVQYQQLSEVIGDKNFDIQFYRYKLYENYPENSKKEYFTLEARENKQLLVIQFDIKNKTSKTKRINLIDSDISYMLDINGDTYKSLLTLLVNDLQFIDAKIAGDKSEKGYLVFEVPKNIKVSTANLYVSKDSLKSSLTLK